jgi:hypothetical protein
LADESTAQDVVVIRGNGTFSDKNVGTGKAVNIGMALSGDGVVDDSGNYALSTSTLSANVGVITQLDSVQWVGANDGTWSNASNWAGGAIPDADNVANVVVPTGAQTVYDSDQFGVSSSAVANQGLISFTSDNAFVLANDISGAGTLAQRGIGELTVSGNNTVTGDIDIGDADTGAVVLAHANAVGQGQVVSNGGTLSVAPNTVLSSLVVNGDVTVASAIQSVGDQIYNGALTFTSSGTRTPSDITTDPARVANFESAQGDIAFMGTVSAGTDSKTAQRSLVVSADNGQVTFDDQVGISVVQANTPVFGTVDYVSGYQGAVDTNPWAVDVTAASIALNADVTTFETQLYTSAVLVGDNGSNGYNRLLLSLDPAITIDGSVDDTVKGQHSLYLRAISLDGQDSPSVAIGEVGQTTPLAALDVLVGSQMLNGVVASIDTNRTTFNGDITIGGSVATVGDQMYVGNEIQIDALSAVNLSTEVGTIDAITGIRSSDPNDLASANRILGLETVSFERGELAGGVGGYLRTLAEIQGVDIQEKVNWLPRVEQVPVLGVSASNGKSSASALASEVFGSGMVESLRRSIERMQAPQTDLADLLELNDFVSADAEVAIGDLQDVSGMEFVSQAGADADTPTDQNSGAKQTGLAETSSTSVGELDCAKPSVANEYVEECQTTNAE